MNNKILEACARAAHETNRAFCIALGDNSQVNWENTSEELKKSCISGVEKALLGCTPEESHKNWSKNRIENGWKFGPVKDVEKKEHPNLVDYYQLSEEQRYKDTLFQAVVKYVAYGLRNA